MFYSEKTSFFTPKAINAKEKIRIDCLQYSLSNLWLEKKHPSTLGQLSVNYSKYAAKNESQSMI